MKTIVPRRIRRAALWVAVAPLLIYPAAPAPAQTFSWSFNGGGSWSVASNWNPAGPPTAGSVVNIVNNDATVRAITFNSDYSAGLLGTFTINQTGAGTSTLTMTSNKFGTTDKAIIGSTGKGALVQSGGTASFGGILSLGDSGSLSAGSYTLSGSGLLNVTGTVNVGGFGIGSFSENGGGASFSSALNIGLSNSAASTYRLSGGTLTVGGVTTVGSLGAGQFIQTGGNATLPGGLVVASGSTSFGTVSLSSTAVLSTSGLEIYGAANVGTFIQSGGTHFTAGSAIFGRDSLAVGNGSFAGGSWNITSDLNLGGSGIGSVALSGGSVSVTGNLGLGSAAFGAGTLNITNTASLIVDGIEFIGANGSGTIFQSSGTHTSNNVVELGSGTSAIGFGSMSGGTWTINSNFAIGLAGTGTMLQTGGSILNTGTEGLLLLADLAGSTGTYSLGGTGALSTGQIIVGEQGSGTMNVSGGSISSTFGLIVGHAAGGTGFVSLSGGSITVASSISEIGATGAGTMLQSGGTFNTGLGTLTIANFAGSAGTYNLSGGTLSTVCVRVGTTGNGTFIQSGGNVTTTGTTSLGLRIGVNAGANGLYQMSGASSVLNVVGGEEIGAGAPGTFLQTGGFHSAGGSVTIGSDLGGAGQGTYSLTGGTLQLLSSMNVLAQGTLILGNGTITGFGTIAQNGKLIQSGNTRATPLLNLRSNSTTNINGTLTLDAGILNNTGAPITGDGTISLLPFATLSGWGAISPSLINNGTVSPSSGNLVINSTAFSNTATISIQPGAAMFVNSPSFSNTGTIVINGGTLNCGSQLLFNNSGLGLTMNGGLLAANIFDNFGTFSGFGQILVPGGVFNTGSMSFTGPSQIIGNLDNTGSMLVQNDKLIVFGSGNNSGTITTANGTVVFTGGLIGNPLGAPALAVGPSGGALASFYRGEALALNGTSLQPANVDVRAKQFGGDTSVVSSLTIAGDTDNWFGQLDVADNAMIIDYTGGPSPLARVENQVMTGRAGGSWTGNGMISSLADATHGLGVGDNTLLGYSTFGGQSVTPSSVLIKFTYLGDTNLDGQVDLRDLFDLASHYNTSANVWTSGDFNYDGKVNVLDLTLLAENWQAGVLAPLGPSLNSLLAGLGLPVTSVPEPGSAGLTGLGLISVLWSRLRRRSA